MPRNTKSKSDRKREQQELDALARVTERATRDLAAIAQGRPVDGAPEIEALIEADELETDRAWDSGASVFTAPRPEQSDDPWAGIRADLERLEEMLERRERNLRHAGTRAAVSGAERNIEALETEIARKRQALFERETYAREVGALSTCRSPACTKTYPTEYRYIRAGLCASCSTPIRNSKGSR